MPIVLPKKSKKTKVLDFMKCRRGASKKYGGYSPPKPPLASSLFIRRQYSFGKKEKLSQVIIDILNFKDNVSIILKTRSTLRLEMLDIIRGIHAPVILSWAATKPSEATISHSHFLPEEKFSASKCEVGLGN